MSQMKRVLDVVQDLRSLADSIAALADATTEEAQAGTAEASHAGTTAWPHAGTTVEALAGATAEEAQAGTAESHVGTTEASHAGSISNKTESATTAQKAPVSPEQFEPATGAAQPDEGRTEGPRPATEAERPSEPAAQPKLSIAELRSYVAERSTPENRPKIRALLARYGVAKLTDLGEEHYTALMAEVDAL